MTCLSRTEIEDLLARFPALHIGVIGDFALDCYWTVDPAAELPSVETGKPTRPVAAQHVAAGAAGNVVADLAALGCGRISAFGVGRARLRADLRFRRRRPGSVGDRAATPPARRRD